MLMLSHDANEVAFRIRTFFTMEVFFNAAVVHDRRRRLFRFDKALVAVLMLSHDANEIAFRIRACFTVEMLFSAAVVHDRRRCLFRLDKAFLAMLMLDRNTNEVAFCIRTFFTMEMLFNTAVVYRRHRFVIGSLIQQLRNGAVADNGGIVQLVGDFSDNLGGIAFDGFQLFFVFHHKADVIRIVVIVVFKEDQITGLGRVGANRMIQVHIRLGQRLNPVLAVRFQRHAFHLGIMQAEGGEHRTPVAVGRSVPCAVAGVASGAYTILQNDVVPGTLVIAQLAFSNRQYVGFPDAGQGDVLEGLFPVTLRFHIGRGIGVAGKLMRVLRQRADDFILIDRYIAGVTVNVDRNIGLFADQRFCTGRFLQRTDPFNLLLIASVRVEMTGSFCKRALQDLFPAVVGVDM